MIVPPEGLVLNIYKPQGITSFGVVSRVRKKLNVKKVGHAGTLDPMAEGTLIVLVGKATKRASEFSTLDKEYRAGILLGKKTDTYDVTGKIIGTGDTSGVNIDRLKAAISEFCGEIEQVPPMYSALKVDGKRLYKLAREGMEIERKSRNITIHQIKLERWENPRLEITVRCSKGTYIRSLAHDLGETLGCGGCLETLVRTAVGSYRIEDALRLDEITLDAADLD
jgi:tRNA pseudouridine55 synthase